MFTILIRAFLVQILAVCTLSLFSQSGKIAGKVIDKKTGETIIGANVIVLQNQTMVTGAATDIDGVFLIEVQEGTYNLQVNYLSYQNQELKDIVVKKMM